MWHAHNKAHFRDCIGNIESDHIVQELKTFKQHTPFISRYHHSLCVAYFSFLFCRTFGMDYKAAARGGMLHDLFHEEWDGSKNGALSRLRTHPIKALENAQRYNLNTVESDIIAKHMWPVSVGAPAYAEGWVVTMFDKVATILEVTFLTHVFGIYRNLKAF